MYEATRVCPLAKAWARLLEIPAYAIYGAIMIFATLGTFASGGGLADLLVLLVIGMLGVLMAMADIPVAPAVVGLILGPLFEEQMLRAVLLSGGSASGLFDGALSISLWCIAALGLVVPLALAGVRRRATAAPERVVAGR